MVLSKMEVRKLSVLLSIVEQIAIWGAGVASMGMSYEPKVPESLCRN